MKRRNIILIAVFFGVTVGVYFILYQEHKERAEREKAEKIEKDIRMQVSTMVSYYNAIDDWDRKLSEENKEKKYLKYKIPTIELEKLWLTNKPILFVGEIEDISMFDNDHYTLRIIRTIGSAKHYLNTELGLVLRVEKRMIDPFLKDHPVALKSFNRVAIIAKINKIKSGYYSDQDGTREEIKMGIGHCLSIQYIGKIRF